MGYHRWPVDPGDDLSQRGNVSAQGSPARRSQRDPRGSATAVNSFAAPDVAERRESPHVLGKHRAADLECAAGAGGTGTLRRYTGYAIQATQPTNTGAAPLSTLSGSGNSLLADKVQACSFALSSGASAGTALVTVRHTHASAGAALPLLPG